MRYSRRGYWGTTALGLLLLGIGVTAVLLGMPAGPSWPKFLAFSVVVIVAYGIVLYAYRSADEVMLGEHKTAWFWGSMGSFILLVPLLTAITWRLVPQPSPVRALAAIPVWRHVSQLTQGMPKPQEIEIGFVDGIAFIVILQLVAFLTVLAWLRLRPARQ